MFNSSLADSLTLIMYIQMVIVIVFEVKLSFCHIGKDVPCLTDVEKLSFSILLHV